MPGGHVVVGEVWCSNPDPAHSGPCTPVRTSAEERSMVDLGPLYYQPRPGDIGLTSISDWGGELIRRMQQLNGCGSEKYEHAFGYVGDYNTFERDRSGKTHVTREDDLIVEAMPEGARKVSNWHDPATTRWLICPDEYRDAMVRLLVEQARKKVKYAWFDYAAIALHRFHLHPPGLKHFIESSHRQICSQLVDWCADNAGWHLFDDGRWPGYVPPCDLNRLWKSLPASAKAGPA
jgi:hypothetical protein